MNDIAIRVEGLSKEYRISGKQERYKTLRQSLVDAAAMPLRYAKAAFSGQRGPRVSEQIVWALKDVSFEVKRGEVVGIIGRNGAGKSTLLKILSRITEPTHGYADIRGRVGSLLEVGTGFHPELTGRENIYLNGAILGMSRVEIDKKFDDIVAFAEVERYVDTAVKHYSSGMYLRLAFAVAAHLEPEVLLVDEVLAVGDAAFQRKCLGKMGSVAREGRTVLLVSHNMAAIGGLCQRTLLLSGGERLVYGDTDAAIRRYVTEYASMASVDLMHRLDREGNGRARIQRVQILDEHRQATDVVQSGSDVVFNLDYAAADHNDIKNVLFEIKVSDRIDQLLFTLSTFLTGESFNSLPGRGTVHCHVPSLLLAPGDYNLRLICYVNGILADLVRDAGTLSVVEADFYGGGKAVRSGTYGPVLMPQRWYHTAPASDAAPMVVGSRAE